MQGVVPAAGQGTRMGELTATRPKGLVEVAGKPLLTHCFETLAGLDVTELVVVVGYRGDDIRSHYGNSFEGIPITYVDQPEPLGLGDALRRAAPVLDGDFVHLNGDNVCEANLAALLNEHRRANADVTMLVEDVSRERAQRGAVLKFDGDGTITGVVEKPTDPPSTTVPRACYAFSERCLEACRDLEPGHTGEYELSDAIDLLLSRGATVRALPLAGWFVNVNSPDDVEKAERRIAGQNGRS